MVNNLNFIGHSTASCFLAYQTNRIHHWCSMETSKSQHEGPLFQLALFLTGAVDPRAGIFLSTLNINGRFFFSPNHRIVLRMFPLCLKPTISDNLECYDVECHVQLIPNIATLSPHRQRCEIGSDVGSSLPTVIITQGLVGIGMSEYKNLSWPRRTKAASFAVRVGRFWTKWRNLIMLVIYFTLPVNPFMARSVFS